MECPFARQVNFLLVSVTHKSTAIRRFNISQTETESRAVTAAAAICPSTGPSDTNTLCARWEWSLDRKICPSPLYIPQFTCLIVVVAPFCLNNIYNFQPNDLAFSVCMTNNIFEIVAIWDGIYSSLCPGLVLYNTILLQSAWSSPLSISDYN